MSLTLLSIAPERRGELALADERVELSWQELDPLLNRAANALSATVDGQRRAAVYAPNSAETVVAYLAGIEGGVSTVPVSYHLTPGEVAYILKDSGASVLMVGPETLEAGLAAAAEAGLARVIGWRCAPRAGLVRWEDWLAAASDAEPPADARPLPHLHYTSGTTGTPKATETPPQYWPEAATVAELAALLRPKATPSPGLAAGPLYHTGPLGHPHRDIANVVFGVFQLWQQPHGEGDEAHRSAIEAAVFVAGFGPEAGEDHRFVRMVVAARVVVEHFLDRGGPPAHRAAGRR